MGQWKKKIKKRQMQEIKKGAEFIVFEQSLNGGRRWNLNTEG